jgi:glycosyltransferase involved in cell wall biosynthesis
VAERPLSFCMVTTFYPPYHFGGDAMYVYRLSNALAARGHRVTVVHNVDAYHALRHEDPGAAFSHVPGVTVRPLRSRVGVVAPLVTYLSGRPALMASSLEEIFSAERFDVVHFHNISLLGSGVLAYGDAIKLYTMHEHWLVCPMHVLWKYDRKPCESAAWLRCTLSYRRPPQLWRYTGQLGRALDHVDAFLSPSRFAMAKHRERGFDREMRHLPYFIPAEAAEPTNEPSPHERPYFLFAGRLERIKGVDTLLDDVRAFHGADLLIAGDGDQGPELERRAADLPHVRFLGRVHPDELRVLYANAIALIVPSVGFEVFPFVTLEALAQGTPVIVRDLGGLPEAVADSGGGLVYRTGEELRRAMQTLQADRDLRDSLGRKGREGYVRLWSEEPHLERYFSTIAELGGERRGVVTAAGR